MEVEGKSRQTIRERRPAKLQPADSCKPFGCALNQRRVLEVHSQLESIATCEEYDVIFRPRVSL